MSIYNYWITSKKYIKIIQQSTNDYDILVEELRDVPIRSKIPPSAIGFWIIEWHVFIESSLLVRARSTGSGHGRAANRLQPCQGWRRNTLITTNRSSNNQLNSPHFVTEKSHLQWKQHKYVTIGPTPNQWAFRSVDLLFWCVHWNNVQSGKK